MLTNLGFIVYSFIVTLLSFRTFWERNEEGRPVTNFGQVAQRREIALRERERV
jgi:hypothetical protein